VSAPGHRKLTTQINIDGDQYLWDDFAFATREGLVPTLHRIDDPAQLDARRLDKPFASIDFDFHLSRESEALPGGDVQRARAAA
jgi:catechol 1,2-dioxygenase